MAEWGLRPQVVASGREALRLRQKHPTYWRLELRYDALSWDKRHKAGVLKGREVPFGAATIFLPPKPLRLKSPKFGTIAVPGFVLGYHLSPGGKWRGEYLVSTVACFRRFGTDRRKVP